MAATFAEFLTSECKEPERQERVFSFLKGHGFEKDFSVELTPRMTLVIGKLDPPADWTFADREIFRATFPQPCPSPPGEYQVIALTSNHWTVHQKGSQPLQRLARPDLQLFVKGCLILRWENKVDFESFSEAERENCEKLNAWSPLFYGRLPYVIGGCCAGNQFQWLMLKPNDKVLVSDPISRTYDLNSVKDVAAFLQCNIRMHCFLQKLQECLKYSVKLCLYRPLDRGNGVTVTVTIYRECVKKEIAKDDAGTKCRESLYDAINDSLYLIHGQVRRSRKNTVLYLELVGDPLSKPVTMSELEFATHDILCGLNDLHKAGYTHRDIRWANCIKVSAKRVMKWILIDLEAAGLADESVKTGFLKTWDEAF